MFGNLVDILAPCLYNVYQATDRNPMSNWHQQIIPHLGTAPANPALMTSLLGLWQRTGKPDANTFRPIALAHLVDLPLMRARLTADA